MYAAQSTCAEGDAVCHDARDIAMKLDEAISWLCPWRQSALNWEGDDLTGNSPEMNKRTLVMSLLDEALAVDPQAESVQRYHEVEEDARGRRRCVYPVRNSAILEMLPQLGNALRGLHRTLANGEHTASSAQAVQRLVESTKTQLRLRLEGISWMAK